MRMRVRVRVRVRVGVRELKAKADESLARGRVKMIDIHWRSCLLGEMGLMYYEQEMWGIPFD